MSKTRYLFPIFLAAFLLATAATPAAAQAPKLTASIDRNQIAIGDAVQLSLTFEGTQEIPPPSISGPEGLAIRYVGPMSRLSIVNGNTTASVTHNYLLIPQRAGSFRIGPFSFTINGNSYSAPAIDFEVLASGTPAPAGPTGQQPAPAVGLKDRIFLLITTAKDTLYLNERSSLTVKLYVSQLSIRDASFPVFESSGFTIERAGDPKQYQVNENGLLYNVLEFDLTIFPMRTGTMTFGPAVVECTQLIARQEQQNPFPNEFFANFFGTYETNKLELKSNTLSINVLPFPEENKPADFKGAIGDFSLSAQIAPSRVAFGDPVTLTMTVTGQGSLKTVSAPVLTDETGFKTYDAQRKDAGNTVTFEQVVVPKDADLTSVPAVRLAFFDPNARAYRTAQAGPFPLEVLPAESAGSGKVVASKEAASQPSAPEELGSDIIYIKEDPGPWEKPDAYLYRQPIMAVPFLLPLLFLLGVWLWGEHQNRLMTDTAYARRFRATPKAQEGFREAAADMAAGRHQEFYTAVSRTLREFLADKCRVPAQTVTPDSLASLPCSSLLGPDVTTKIQALLTKCDDIRYASLTASQDEMNKDLTVLREALDRISKIHV